MDKYPFMLDRAEANLLALILDQQERLEPDDEVLLERLRRHALIGKFRQPWEGYDEYCSRVDDELREAGEIRYGPGPILFVTILIFIAAVVGYVVWRYYQ